ncbi:MAG: hypothetical protein KF841_03735 [Phycisphaerae bacterium]|nr:hypothetical protein [Phycisphaerae bacterium]
MKNKTARRFKVARRIAIVLAAAPLFQFQQCQTFNNRLGANFANALPSAVYSVLLNIALLPIQLILSGGNTTTG